jgi:hypothetical protein
VRAASRYLTQRDEFNVVLPQKKVPPRPQRVRVLEPFFLRVVLLAALAVGATGYAIIRYYTRPRPPMTVPARDPAPSNSTEIPAPEIVPADE